jgi:hypothetical protein
VFEEQRGQGLIRSGGNAVLATHYGTVLGPCRRRWSLHSRPSVSAAGDEEC